MGQQILTRPPQAQGTAVLPEQSQLQGWKQKAWEAAQALVDGPFAAPDAGEPSVLNFLAALLGTGVVGMAKAKSAGPAVKEAIGTMAERMKGIKAYHGSPHDFDKFSLDNIGTGEGAQTFGHGLYFAENEGVANGYRKSLSGLLPEGWATKYPDPARGYIRAVVGDVADGKLTPEQAAKYVFNANSVMREYPQAQLATEIADAAKAVKGRMYEVNINADPEDMLDWDVPLSQQSEKVRTKLKAVQRPQRSVETMSREELIDVLQHVDPDGTFTDAATRAEGYDPLTLETAREIARDMGIDEYLNADFAKGGGQETGQSLYRQMTAQHGGGNVLSNSSQAAVSQRLREAGIPGVKYLDGASRNKGEGSRNFVLFDDSLVEILRKYGFLPPVAAGMAAQQQRDR